jgi:hypothetical protein
MQINISKAGEQKVKLTKTELGRIDWMKKFLSTIPKGLHFEEERRELEDSVDRFMLAVAPDFNDPLPEDSC